MPNEQLTLKDLRDKFEELDAEIKASRNEDHPLRRRLRRSLSWFERADSDELDDDVRYIFLWVAFNAAYADAQDLHLDEWERYSRYFKKLTEKPNNVYRIYNILKCELGEECLSLVGNRYVFRGFWRFLDDSVGRFSEEEWKESEYERSLQSESRRVRRLLGFDDRFGPMRAALEETGFANRSNTIDLLNILFRRLYVLRNQIMHGSSTSQAWMDTKRSDSREGSTSTEDGSLNRNQVEDGVRILSCLMPLFLDVMMNHTELELEEYWGRLLYPVRSDIREDRRSARR